MTSSIYRYNKHSTCRRRRREGERERKREREGERERERETEPSMENTTTGVPRGRTARSRVTQVWSPLVRQ